VKIDSPRSEIGKSAMLVPMPARDRMGRPHAAQPPAVMPRIVLPATMNFIFPAVWMSDKRVRRRVILIAVKIAIMIESRSCEEERPNAGFEKTRWRICNLYDEG